MGKQLANYKNIVIQIATPFTRGTGFYVKSWNMVVTNEHVVRGSREAVIEGELFERRLAKVVFLDTRHDLALLSISEPLPVPDVSFGTAEVIKVGDSVVAIGHPFGLKFSTTQGIISSTDFQQQDISYFQHDAALNPGNSGGPLLNNSGEIIGVNTFVVKDGENMGFSLPITYLKETIEEYQRGGGRSGSRCASCTNIVFEKEQADKYCPFCGKNISLPSFQEEYEPVGIAYTIEHLIKQSGHDVKLSRRGPNKWEIHQGSAKVEITYQEKTGLIIGDAYLVNLPRQDIGPLYEYLLRQNYAMDGLTFSVNPNGQEIILSLLIYDRYLNAAIASRLFENLFEKADLYDDILVNDFGAEWRQDD